MSTHDARNSTLSLLTRGARVMALTAVAVSLAVVTLWCGILFAPLCVIAGLCALPVRPSVSVACFGYALVMPWWLAFVAGPVFATLSLLGVVIVAVGLWHALPGRWVCPDCRHVEIRLPNPIPVRCPACDRVNCPGNTSRDRLARPEEYSRCESGDHLPPGEGGSDLRPASYP